MQLKDSVRTIKGVGEKAQQLYEKMNIFCVGDLLEHFPRQYDIFEPIVPISQLRAGEVFAIEGFLKERPQVKRAGRLKILSLEFGDESGTVLVTWFNMAFLLNQLHLGSRYILRGQVSEKRGRIVLEQPKIFAKQDFYNNVGKMMPIYSLTSGLTNRAVQKAVEVALSETEEMTEYLPSEIRKDSELILYKKAIQQIHFPKNIVEYRQARKRLVFDELFLYNMALLRLKEGGKKESIYPYEIKREIVEFEENLPFQLTNAQQKVYEEILEDIMSNNVMNRLVQGDVGSGKTILAVLLLLLTAKNGYQGAFMVPTEVLAMQHYKTLCSFFEPLGIRTELLCGSMTAKQKREAYEKIEHGECHIVVGTHAIIQEKVEFDKLALVITDEQHRFGVRQREALYKKGQEPHVLAMSATPIPRTLALILYGDMDLSVVDELPANRLPIKNCVVGTEYRPQAYRFMKDEIEKGHQIYIICPMVEESETTDLENVTLYTEELKDVFPGNVRIQDLHGKMRPAQKNEIMKDFSDGTIDILVSTTVVEVGVDVPNATVIMIENSERFGLAQLHQLRGRVGRGHAQSYCILMSGVKSKEAMERLRIVAGSNDGFYLASEDLKLRGQGDLFGIRQSGELFFKLADIYEDAQVLTMASRKARTFSADEVDLLCKKNKRLREVMERYMGEVPL